MHLKRGQKSPVSALILSVLSVKTNIMSKRNSEVFFGKGVVLQQGEKHSYRDEIASVQTAV